MDLKAQIKNIEPFDLALHVGIGLAATLLGLYISPYLGAAMVVANWVFWPWRENSQTDNQDWALRYWSLKKHLEAFAPGVAATIAAVAWVLL